MASIIELEEQIKKNREQIKLIKKKEKEDKFKLACMKSRYREYSTSEGQIEGKIYREIYNLQSRKFPSFERLVKKMEWKNFRYEPIYWELMFSELKFNDRDFFNIFMGWGVVIQTMDLDDRKCSVCLEYYSVSKKIKCFTNCSHCVCKTCYIGIRPATDKFKCCVICRESEKPKVALPVVEPPIVAPTVEAPIAEIV